MAVTRWPTFHKQWHMLGDANANSGFRSLSLSLKSKGVIKTLCVYMCVSGVVLHNFKPPPFFSFNQNKGKNKKQGFRCLKDLLIHVNKWLNGPFFLNSWTFIYVYFHLDSLSLVEFIANRENTEWVKVHTTHTLFCLSYFYPDNGGGEEGGSRNGLNRNTLR